MDVYTEVGIETNLRDVVMNLIIDYGLLECKQDNIYHDLTITSLVEAAKEGRSSTLILFETDNLNSQLQVFANERNKDRVEEWIRRRMKQSKGFSFKLNFKSPTLRNHFPPNNATTQTRDHKPPHQSAVTVTTLNLPALNTKGFSKPDVSKLQEDTLNAVNEWHNQVVTHAFTNGFYVPDWHDYAKNQTMGVRWSKAYVGADAHSNRSLISKMLNTFLLKDFVISNSFGLSDLIITTETDRYQALYNILVKRHPNLSNKHKVQTVYPQQGSNDSFSSHVKQVQQYLAAERALGREYTYQEVLALTIRTLQDKFRSEFLNKAEKETFCADPSFKLLFELRLCAVSSTFTEWVEELGLHYNPLTTSTKSFVNSIASEE